MVFFYIRLAAFFLPQLLHLRSLWNVLFFFTRVELVAVVIPG